MFVLSWVIVIVIWVVDVCMPQVCCGGVLLQWRLLLGLSTFGVAPSLAQSHQQQSFQPRPLLGEGSGHLY